MSVVVPATPIVKLYDALHQRGFSRKRKLLCAKQFVCDPGPLAGRFHASVAALAAYIPADEGFYTSRSHYEVGDKKKASTTDLALRIRDAGGLTPTASTGTSRHDTELRATGVTTVQPGQLASEYLDRELVATRTTGGATGEGTAVRLDLLLCNAADRTPIIAEVKRTSDVDPHMPHRKPTTDKDPFSALVQALACAAQLSTQDQYKRLARWGRAETRGGKDYPGPADIAPSETPVFDVYVVLHNRPTGTYLAELGEETEHLAIRLLAQPTIARHIRRIACVLTELQGDTLCSGTEWAYQRPRAHG